MYVFGSSNDGKLGIFRLDENMVSRGAGNSSGYYIIDFPWLLDEEVPPRFYRSSENIDIYTLQEYDDFNNLYTSQGLIHNDLGYMVVQVVCTENNSYLLMRDGRVYATGANSKWQCTEIESITNDEHETVASKYLEMSAQDRIDLEAYKNDKNKARA